MQYRFLNNVEVKLLYLENKCGKYLTAFIVSFVLIGIAALYVTPALQPMQLGRGYASLSVNPFDLTEQNDLRFRILTPLLAYMVGLRGSLYIFFPMIIALIFLAVLYFYLRKRQNAMESLFITMLVCYSTPILFLLHFQGYVDVTSYLLILLIITLIKRPLLWTFLVALLILNHDSNLFILPALLFFYYMQTEDKLIAVRNIIFGVLIAFIPFYLYRSNISELSPVGYTFEMYGSQIKSNVLSIANYFLIGFFYSFKLFWVFPFLATYYYWKEKNREQSVFFCLILMGALAQLLFASDTSRLIGLAFPLVIFSAIKVSDQWGKELFLKRTMYLILFNFLIPQYYVGQSTMIRFYSLPSSYILKHFFGVETWVG